MTMLMVHNTKMHVLMSTHTNTIINRYSNSCKNDLLQPPLALLLLCQARPHILMYIYSYTSSIVIPLYIAQTDVSMRANMHSHCASYAFVHAVIHYQCYTAFIYASLCRHTHARIAHMLANSTLPQ